MEPHDQLQLKKQLDKILQSERFRGSPKLSCLLRYRVERAITLQPEELKAHLKESVVAFEVFNEQLGGGDSKKSTVRVQAINLRNALVQYYSSEGLYDDLAIMLPT